MKEQLTIQELSAYLPYEVMCLNQHLPDVEFVEEELIGIENHITWCGRFNARHGSNHVPVSAIKPILYQLSSLTKEIEHKGERFVPIDYLIEIHGNGLDYSYLISQKNVKEYSFDIVQKLLEWKFDVFGLLDRGLAVNKLEL